MVKKGLRFRINLRFRMSLCSKNDSTFVVALFEWFLGKLELRFRMKLSFRKNLRFRMNLCPKLHMPQCLFGLFRPSKIKKERKKDEMDNYYFAPQLKK